MLTEDQVNKIRHTMSTSGWNEVIIPAVLSRGKQALTALTLSQEERVKAGGDFKDTDDALLRAIIRDAEWFSVAFQNEVKVFDYNRRQDELQTQRNGVET